MWSQNWDPTVLNTYVFVLSITDLAVDGASLEACSVVYSWCVTSFWAGKREEGEEVACFMIMGKISRGTVCSDLPKPQAAEPGPPKEWSRRAAGLPLQVLMLENS